MNYTIICLAGQRLKSDQQTKDVVTDWLEDFGGGL
jgi:hypothetical protein